MSKHTPPNSRCTTLPTASATGAAESIPQMRATVAVLFSLALLAATFVYASGCNTVEGAGEDVEAVGEGVQDAAD